MPKIIILITIGFVFTFTQLNAQSYGVLKGKATLQDGVTPVTNLELILTNANSPALADTAYSDSTGGFLFDDASLKIIGNERPLMPEGFELGQNTPNEFSKETAIGYTVSLPGKYELNVYNLLGQKVKTLQSGNMHPGKYRAVWDGRNEFGKGVADGIYLYTLETPYGILKRKAVKLDKGPVAIYSAIGGILSRAQPETEASKPIQTAKTVSQDYTLEARNTPETNPRINPQTFNVNVQGDTTNFDLFLSIPETANISGNLYDLLQEGNIPIAGAIATFGSVSDTTDSEGNYTLSVTPGTTSRLVFNHPAYYERQTAEFAALLDTIINETMIDTSFSMEHYDQVCRYATQGLHPGTQRWTTVPTIYMNTSAAQHRNGDSTEVTQAMIDTALSVIRDLPQFAYQLFPGDTVEVETGTNPPWGQEGYIIFSWNNTIPGAGQHYEHLDGNRIDFAMASVSTGAGRGVYVQELSQVLGARADSNIFQPSIVNSPPGGHYYFPVDFLIGKFLYSRQPGNLSPDMDP